MDTRDSSGLSAFSLAQFHAHVAENTDVLENILSIAEAEYVAEKASAILTNGEIDTDILEHMDSVKKNALAALEFHLKTWVELSGAIGETLLLPVHAISEAHKEHLDHISDDEKWFLLESYSQLDHPISRAIKSTAESIRLILWFIG